MFQNKLLAIMLIFFILIISGCIDDGEESSEIVLPTNNYLNLYCENEGIHPEKCVMDDEENPYRFVAVNDDTKWDLSKACASAKASFYLWATALASQSVGEHQYYVAESLHKLYTLEKNENIRKQTIKAYRAVLDHFFEAKMYIEAWWIKDEDLAYAEGFIRHMVGRRLFGIWEGNDNEGVTRTYNIDGMKLGNGMILDNLFETEFHAQAAMNEWGYVYQKYSLELFRD